MRRERVVLTDSGMVFKFLTQSFLLVTDNDGDDGQG